MINFRFITNIIGKLLFVESAFLALCIIVALIYEENDLMAFAATANADIRQRRAFMFHVDDDIPCGEVFRYLHAIKEPSTLVGVSFNQPEASSDKEP